jgi:hypothetical protein
MVIPLRDFGPYASVCMLVDDYLLFDEFRSYGIIFITMFTALEFPVIPDV